jgi:Mg2+ and Co2+ transporter CorA
LAKANEIRNCHKCKQALINAFLMPSLWWTDHLRKSNGYFGCEVTRDGEKITGLSKCLFTPEQWNSGNTNRSSIDSWAFFQSKKMTNVQNYVWSKFNIFTRWISETKQTAILIFDTDDHTPHPFENLTPEEHLLGDPFWIYPYILNSISDLEENAVWAIRDQIRPIERHDEPTHSSKGQPPDYRKLHNIARHSIHVTETLDVALQTIERILENHRTYMYPGDSVLSPLPQTSQAWQAIQSRLSFPQSFLGSLRHRSISNEKRLKNEIQLTFQKVARHDALVMIDDSAALKTLAFVTFTFLPPTFICAMFSMSFFNYDQGVGWKVSEKFWIYWAFAVPTTVISAALWFHWQRNPPSRQFEDRRMDAFSRDLDRMENV